MSALTLEALAREKRLPAGFLKENGVDDHPSGIGVSIGYIDGSGKQHGRLRLRTALNARDGSIWLGDKRVAPIAYGVWKLEKARQQRLLILVEGESDCWTLWHYGYPALGIPGATMSKTLLADYLTDIAQVFVWREPDQGGTTFISKISERLKQLKFAGEVFQISLDGFKDPSQLHCADPARFVEAFEAALNHAQALNVTASGGSLEAILTPLSEIEPENVEWLWEQRIAVGKLNLIVGDPGLGKSFLTLEIAARVSTGETLPGGKPCQQGSVVLITGEDGLADTIRPRLDAQGANVRCVHHLRIQARNTEQRFQLREHLGLLRAKISELGDVRLLIIDPLTAYLGEADSNKDAQVRALLTPMAELAAELHIAVVAVMHLNKAAVLDVIYRVTGSVAFIAQARTAWVVVEDPDNPVRRLLLKLKNNLASAEAAGLAFAIQKDDQGRARLEWESDSIKLSVREVMGGFSNPRQPRGRKPEKIEDAKAFLQTTLAGGEPRGSRGLIEEANASGIAYRTLCRAADELGVAKEKAGFGNEWTWRLTAGSSASSRLSEGNLATSTKCFSPNGLNHVGILATSGKPHEDAKIHENSDRQRFEL